MKKQLFVLTGFFVYLLIAFPAYGLDDVEQRLRDIRQRIEKTSESLAEQKTEEQSLLKDLAILNTTLKQIDRRIKKLKEKQHAGEKQIEKTRGEIKVGKRKLQNKTRQLKKRLIALYKEGESGPLKVLFSANSPMELAQQYQYLTRVLDSDKELMAEFRTDLRAQEERLTNLKELEKKQQKLLDRQQRQRASAREARSLQSRLLKNVRSDKKTLRKQLQELQERARRMEALINRLEPADQTQSGRSGIEFAALRGTLPWPMRGSIVVGFGTQKSKGLGTLYESNGVEISGRGSSQIRAVASGKVAFASYFKGYGNLIIVSHQGGYHTLYAQASELFKQAGELVEAGETLGRTASGERSVVYFEIRQSGVPVDPVRWLAPQ